MTALLFAAGVAGADDDYSFVTTTVDGTVTWSLKTHSCSNVATEQGIVVGCILKKNNNVTKSVDFSLIATPLTDCKAGYGTVKFSTFAGVTTSTEDVATGGGSMVAFMFDSLCAISPYITPAA